MGDPVRARDLVAAVDQAIEDLRDVRATLTEAMVRAHRDSEGGFGAGGRTEAVSQSSIPDRATGERALAHWHPTADTKEQPLEQQQLVHEADSVARNAQRLIHSIAAARAASQIARRSAHALLPIAQHRAEALVAEIEGGPAYCANCGVEVWRHANDRLLAGRCRPCYEWRRAHDGVERPRELWPDSIKAKSAAR